MKRKRENKKYNMTFKKDNDVGFGKPKPFNPAETIRINFNFIGPVAEHNLICWVCNRNHAVYDMNPVWIFRPCWNCQKQGIGDRSVAENNLQSWVLKLVRLFGG